MYKPCSNQRKKMLDLKKYAKVGIAAASLYVVGASALLSAQVDNELSFNVGCRNATVTRKVRDRSSSSFSGESSDRQHLKVKDANLWQIGVEGIFGAPDCFCECGTEWLSNLYARGYAYYGWYTDGKLHRNSHFRD